MAGKQHRVVIVSEGRKGVWIVSCRLSVQGTRCVKTMDSAGSRPIIIYDIPFDSWIGFQLLGHFRRGFIQFGIFLFLFDIAYRTFNICFSSDGSFEFPRYLVQAVSSRKASFSCYSVLYSLRNFSELPLAGINRTYTPGAY